MSRIGRKPIPVPEKVKVQIQGVDVSVEGPKGKLKKKFDSSMKISMKENIITIERADDTRKVRALHGLTRALLANMVHGVSEGFTRGLEINGVGYRAAVKGKTIDLTLGFSHPVNFPLPEGVSAKVDANTKLFLESADKELVGQTAAQIRSLRPPEPYQGKGVKYMEETIRRKVGKSAGK